MLQTLEQIGSLFVFIQGFLTFPAIYSLYIHKQVKGMSLWTMSFYCFASWNYVPIFWMSGLYWTTFGVVFLGTAELVWCIWAYLLIKTKKIEVV